MSIGAIEGDEASVESVGFYSMLCNTVSLLLLIVERIYQYLVIKSKSKIYNK
ncbi:uncharacterized protein PHALS_09236 [Plasmopara halstedii]|uniref:Uncharacterized protein n=1 Tax=Plasmopara halstedii TaxID=4781 RepID=A0A0P1A5G0_PLAHL|nr:uncharacterized protein PHALS_09236 [Plasmopara halstedii]CEG35240.1 hypothetical protein PHALS_09236 [Plasmopara halstedii]|eukprot:XP_024571609.1 hypothetical protein PHALS_09236 [Plasmopara halstedii]